MSISPINKILIKRALVLATVSAVSVIAVKLIQDRVLEANNF